MVSELYAGKDIGITMKIHEIDNKSDLVRRNVRIVLESGPAAARVVIGHGIVSTGSKPDAMAGS